MHRLWKQSQPPRRQDRRGIKPFLGVLGVLAVQSFLVGCQQRPADDPSSRVAPTVKAAPPEAPLPVLDEREDADVTALRANGTRAAAEGRLAKRMTSSDAADGAAATQLVKLLEDDDLDLRRAARELVRARLGAKIGGDYLARLGGVLRGDLTPPDEKTPDRQPGKAIFDTLAYLELATADEATKADLIAWARQHAKLTRPSDGVRAPFPAWHALLSLGILRDGMPLAEAVMVLGPPTTRTATRIEWYAESPMHVNPSLGAELRGDALSTIHVSMK